jgi:hypothetical protein
MPLSRASSSAGRQPTEPTSPSASPGDGQVTVNFTASTYLGKPAASTYRVTAYNTSNSPIGVSGTTTGTSLTLGLSNGSTYRFTVRLEGVANSLESTFSNDATPQSAAPPPCVPNGSYDYYYDPNNACGQNGCGTAVDSCGNIAFCDC